MPTDPNQSTDLKAPSFPIRNILYLIPQVRAAFASGVGYKADSDKVYSIAMEVTRALELPSEAAVHQSILNFRLGKTPDDEFTVEDNARLAVRFAGQINRLRLGQAIVPWSSMSPLDWSAVQIVDLRPGARFFKNRETVGKVAKLYGIAGPLSGEKIDWFFASSMSRHLGIKLGFSKFSRGKYPKDDDMEMCQLRLAVQAESKDGRPMIRATDCSASMIEYNRSLMSMRLRRDFECPFQYHHQCHQCPAGSNECPAAVRYAPLELKICSECREDKHHSSNPWALGVCLQCSHKQQRKS